jgi:oxalate decarboxylase/phosphoglucose isomerase-like protein (cupin superfamily)
MPSCTERSASVPSLTKAPMVQEVNAVTDNAAVLQQRVTKGTNQFLATLAEPGESQFLTVLKPCSILLPHTHQRANEFYSVIFGIMDAGIAQESGAAQDITFDVNPGEVFVVPQGLLHHNHNAQCTPNAFLQSFTSSDPGALNVIGALAAMGAGSDAGAAAIAASGADLVEASAESAFALDQACLKRCGSPATGAPGDGLADLPDDFRALFRLPTAAEDGKKW